MFEELSDVEIVQIEFENKKTPEYPCHTQCVERYVKLVTEASEAVYGAENRNGWILNTILTEQKIQNLKLNRISMSS